MFATWRMRKRRPSSSQRSAQAGTARCGCAHAGRASRTVLAKRARTRNRSQSGSVHAAAALPRSTDPHSLRAAALPVAAAAATSKMRTRESHHGPRSGPDSPAECPGRSRTSAHGFEVKAYSRLNHAWLRGVAANAGQPAGQSSAAFQPHFFERSLNRHLCRQLLQPSAHASAASANPGYSSTSNP